MTPLLLLVAALFPGPVHAQVPAPRVWPLSLAVNRCFSRAQDVPDPERVNPHLPATVCLGVVDVRSATLVAVGTVRYGNPENLAGKPVSLKIDKAAKGYRVEAVVEASPEDPAGDTGATSLVFAMDDAGRIDPASLTVIGRVACTFKPVCRGEEDLEIGYEPLPGPKN